MRRRERRNLAWFLLSAPDFFHAAFFRLAVLMYQCYNRILHAAVEVDLL